MYQYVHFVRQGWPLLAFGFLSFFWGNFGQSFFIGVYGESIKSSLDLTASQYGRVYSVATLFSGSVIMLIGHWIDKTQLKKFTLYVVVGLFIACAFMASTSHVVILFVGFFLVRLCGQGMFPHIAVVTMARSFSANRGKAVSVAASGVPVGEVILPLLAVMLIASVGWQVSWWIIASTVPLIYFPLAWGLLKKAEKNGIHFDVDALTVDASPSDTLLEKADAGRRDLVKDYRFWLALPVLLTGPFVVTGVFIHQDFVLAQKSWSPEWFATSFIIYGIIHWVASMIMGVLVDRYSAKKLFAFQAIPIMFGLLALGYLEGAWVAWFSLALFGLSIGCMGPIGGSLWAEMYGIKQLGSIRSLVSTFGVWSTALSPTLFGELIDAGATLTEVCNGLAIYVLVATVLACFSYGRR